MQFFTQAKETQLPIILIMACDLENVAGLRSRAAEALGCESRALSHTPQHLGKRVDLKPASLECSLRV